MQNYKLNSQQPNSITFDPDTTSGGYDGTAARNQLISDGFTVTIT